MRQHLLMKVAAVASVVTLAGCGDGSNGFTGVAMTVGLTSAGANDTDVGGTDVGGTVGGMSGSGAATSTTDPTANPTSTTGATDPSTATGATDSAGTTDADSTSTGAGSTGEPPECILDGDCDPGNVCELSECVAGCNMMQACNDGLECCAGTCIDTSMDFNNCTACGNVCPAPDNIEAFCADGCQLGACDIDTFNCDGLGDNGCESEVECTCTPGEMQPCYPGPAGTEGVGECHAGLQACNPFGTGWGACIDFQIPGEEVCANGLDDDCNGADDDIADIDGDGWTVCDNDCCELEEMCSDPALVNPGAFEFVGNGVDDDCDPASSDLVAAPNCSPAAVFGAVTPVALAQAMELCQMTTAAEPLATRKWGLISAQFVNADGSAPNAAQLAQMMDSGSAVLANYGTGGVVPQAGPTMAGISSGAMRDQNDPGYINPNGGTDFGRTGNPPAAYLAANGGALPSSAGCSGNCPAGAGANDSINLRLRIRVPTNALSFAYSFRFFSSEYWTWACTTFNDFFLALLDTTAAGIPADGNISFDALNNPVSVNNGFFDSCVAMGCYVCPSGQGALIGTGMELGNTGGGTSWLQTTAPIVPGEVITLELAIFDVSDGILDSLVLLDAFQWSIDPSGVGTLPQ